MPVIAQVAGGLALLAALALAAGLALAAPMAVSAIAGAVAVLAALALAAALWFDRLFEAPTAVYASSLVEHLGARSVLVVFAHPDDETLAAGALADAGRRDGVVVRTITLTRGENGHPEPHVCRLEDLPLVRESELRRYGFALGVDHQELWDYPDGGLDAAPRGDVVDRVLKRIREWRPDLVLTFDPAGGYTGHPDHTAAGAITTQAVRAALDPAYKPDLGEAHRPRHLAYVLAPARAFRALGGPHLREVAADQPHATLAVPAGRAVRVLGWRTHASQHLQRAYPLPGWLLFDFWDKEHYALWAGPDGGA